MTKFVYLQLALAIGVEGKRNSFCVFVPNEIQISHGTCVQSGFGGYHGGKATFVKSGWSSLCCRIGLGEAKSTHE